MECPQMLRQSIRRTIIIHHTDRSRYLFQSNKISSLEVRRQHRRYISSRRYFSSSSSSKQDEENQPLQSQNPKSDQSQSKPTTSSSSTSSSSSSSPLPYKPGERPTDKPTTLHNLNEMIKSGISRSSNLTTSQRSSSPSTTDVDKRLDNLFGPSRRYNNNNSRTKESTSMNKNYQPKSPSIDLYALMGESRGQINKSNNKQQSIQQQKSQDTIFSNLDQHLAAEIARLDLSSTSSSSPAIQLRLRPSLGRTVNVRGVGGDLTRAFRTLEMKCNANKVRADERNQRTHVRRGQRKKDLKSRRWRVLFRDGFLDACKRVRRMRRQGW